ncbi:hypothetical protein AB3X52_13800 [Nocardioides sp. DS6]|uniref:Ribosomally synthesized peptide with SipW-like signal peptide n=1 Tax=Nocardioides eburneus TaxID=3231482 RepID=A0ABV3T0P9_9ACTN
MRRSMHHAAGRADHRATTRRATRWRVRASLGLAAASLAVVALTTNGSWAFWTDSSTVTGGALTAGTMDLQLQTTNPNGAVGLATAYSASDIAVSGLTPSEARAFPVTVKDVGNADFTYAATVTQGTSPSWGYAAGDITVRFYAGTPDTSDTTYPIQQTCGGTALTAAVAVGTSGTTVIPSRRLAAGASESLCVVVTMATTASNADQGQSGSLRFDFTATQVTS